MKIGFNLGMQKGMLKLPKNTSYTLLTAGCIIITCLASTCDLESQSTLPKQ